MDARCRSIEIDFIRSIISTVLLHNYLKLEDQRSEIGYLPRAAAFWPVIYVADQLCIPKASTFIQIGLEVGR